MKTIILWCDGGYEAKWKEMDRVCKGIPEQAMTGDQKLATTCHEDMNPLVSFTLSTWFDVIKRLNFWNQLKT